MLLSYLFCLTAGIALISLSLSDDGALDGEGGPLSILFSTPFWSFGLTGFGLSGVLMSVLVGESSWLPNSLMALMMGLAMGAGATKILTILGHREADSLVRSDDLIGMMGRITLAVETGQRGFVELSVKGSLLRRPARCSSGSLAKNQRVVVVEINAQDASVFVEPINTAD
jgi:membrane protein implicated in regulation of membrane protease activity